MHRFFITPKEQIGDEIVFSALRAKQISRVLRLAAGAHCVVLDNLGNEMLVELTRVSAGDCAGRILETTSAVEPGIKLTMLISLTQREKFEWMLQKCTEIGVSAFQPLITSRTLVQSRQEAEGKYERWLSIIREAAEQSGRGRLPELLPVESLPGVLRTAAQSNEMRVIPWEGELKTTLKDTIHGKQATTVAALIGPEGGFSADEVQQAVEAGFVAVTLGKRILRMETAALVTAALIFHELE